MNALGRACATILLVAAMAAGCGGDNNGGGPPPEPSDPSKFVGTWEVVAGILGVVCSSGQAQSFEITQPMTFVLGTTSDIVNADATCPIQYNVAGDVATALPRQTCTHPGVITDLHPEDLTFTLGSGTLGTGNIALHQGAGTLSRFNDISAGSPVSCTFTQSSMYQRQ